MFPKIKNHATGAVRYYSTNITLAAVSKLLDKHHHGTRSRELVLPILRSVISTLIKELLSEHPDELLRLEATSQKDKLPVSSDSSSSSSSSPDEGESRRRQRNKWIRKRVTCRDTMVDQSASAMVGVSKGGHPSDGSPFLAAPDQPIPPTLLVRSFPNWERGVMSLLVLCYQRPGSNAKYLSLCKVLFSLIQKQFQKGKFIFAEQALPRSFFFPL